MQTISLRYTLLPGWLGRQLKLKLKPTNCGGQGQFSVRGGVVSSVGRFDQQWA